jgi:hypothetical protein
MSEIAIKKEMHGTGQDGTVREPGLAGQDCFRKSHSRQLMNGK